MNLIIDGIIVFEGGYVFNFKDKGGVIYWGIIEVMVWVYGYVGDMWDLIYVEVYVIFEVDYWIKSGFDVILMLLWLVLFELCDVVVNIGVYYFSVWL